MAHHKDELECDMAETYHIYDLRALPLDKLATMAMAGAKLTTNETLLCLIVDRLTTLAWMQSRDGAAGRNRPKSILEELTKDKEKDFETFSSFDEFEAARKKIIGG